MCFPLDLLCVKGQFPLIMIHSVSYMNIMIRHIHTHWAPESKIRPYPSLGSLPLHQLQKFFLFGFKADFPEIQDFQIKLATGLSRMVFQVNKSCPWENITPHNAFSQPFVLPKLLG